MACQHIPLNFNSLKPSIESDYTQASPERLQAAMKVDQPARKKAKTGNKSTNLSSEAGRTSNTLPLSSTFPAPLVVPGDELSFGVQEPAQSVQDWLELDCRNPVNSRRKTIYIVAPPAVADEVDFVNDWSVPDVVSCSKRGKTKVHALQPSVEDVVEYLRAFYHGMPVKLFDQTKLEFISWQDDKTSKKRKRQALQYVGLKTGEEVVRIRCRPSLDRIFQGQLNQLDLLDVAIGILPDDAYALVMLVHHDLYEDEDDDFCCGRAFGGSRVAVVSTARYRPELDKKVEIDVEHSWPASHCSTYLGKSFSDVTSYIPKKMLNQKSVSKAYPGSAVAEAVHASSLLPLPSTAQELSTLWLGRVCKTASHELGHCFGIGHCSYYACIMQATARLSEDVRQPPYLCPIDLSKVLRATGTGEKERYRALLAVCNRWKDDRLFAAFGAWIETRLKEPDAAILE